MNREQAFAEAFRRASMGGQHGELRLFRRDKGTVIPRPGVTPRRFLTKGAVDMASRMLSIRNRALYIQGRY